MTISIELVQNVSFVSEYPSCYSFILTLSPGFNKINWVKKELSQSLEQKIKYLVVFVTALKAFQSPMWRIGGIVKVSDKTLCDICSIFLISELIWSRLNPLPGLIQSSCLWVPSMQILCSKYLGQISSLRITFFPITVL